MAKCEANCKKVFAYYPDGTFYREFRSLKETAEVLFYNYNYLHQCVNGKKGCKAYRFSYEKF